MTYRFTDYDGEGLSIKRDEEGEGLMVDKFGEGFVWVNNHEAPRIALEILKAAGIDMDHKNVGLSMAARHLRDVVSIREGEKKAEALDKRRAEVCKELGAAFVPAAADTALKRAIDRIIELEQAAK